MNMHEDVSRFCAQLGADTLLVQGAGGNVSWKDGDTLWIKASGTWLRDALSKDIFVPVDLLSLRSDLNDARFDVTPTVQGGATLRPSSETVLHALFPQHVVVHIHAIDALAWLVRADPWTELQSRLPSRWNPCFVPYRKPGAELARVVQSAVEAHPGTQLVCMGSHGVVIAGETLAEVNAILADLIQVLRISPEAPKIRDTLVSIPLEGGRTLSPISDPVVQGLDLSGSGLARMTESWALYPDHVVFLGDRPICHDTVEAAIQRCQGEPGWGAEQPHFIRDVGVFTLGELPPGRMAQLRCYADVLARQSPDQALQVLSGSDVAELLNWDAERYRQQLNKSA
jgi:rhamnose utilization protein RhaD (predicted bifunctional aldolase and dehydrogenase)